MVGQKGLKAVRERCSPVRAHRAVPPPAPLRPGRAPALPAPAAGLQLPAPAASLRGEPQGEPGAGSGRGR